MPAAASMKYLYERLDDKRFQKMCAALIVSQMRDVEVFPVGQSDGGRDITAGKRGIVIQVKSTKDRVRNPVGWIKSAVAAEADNIRRLVAKGCTSYIFMTNIEGSATPDTGDRDKIATELEKQSEAFGVPMTVMWCSEIDAWVDLAGPNLKLAYVEMLAGSELLVALFQSTKLEARERRERDFLLDYVGRQWQRDRKVKFDQVELKSNLITDLFVDLHAERTVKPTGASGHQLPLGNVGALASHLTDSGIPPLTHLEGVPGQGKSTTAQYVCQAYRVAFFDVDEGPRGPDNVKDTLPAIAPAEMRLPIRIDLADYALWLSGYDPFDLTTEQNPATAKPRKRADVELFLVKHFAFYTSGYDLDLNAVRDLLDRVATQIVFDGLDEVANPAVRERVVEAIDVFIAQRSVVRPGNMRVLVTTRPNASDLPEPSPELFQRLRLSPMNEDLRKRYLRQWAAVQQIEKPDLRTLEQVFDERTAAPHIAQLVNNPMQLALLLHLMKTKRDALPSARTLVYKQYMELFLDREVEKSTLVSPVVKQHRDDIQESAAYVGWYMQGRAEIDAAATRLPETTIVGVMNRYLAGLQRKAPVEEVFIALKDRVWVLTSKETGTYEFDVQPVREYVTAQYLHDFAQGVDGRSVPRDEVLVEMLPRAYWANTARFLAGHFVDNQLADLVDSLTETLTSQRHARQIRTTLWALLADGVFKKRPIAQARLARALADDLTAALLRPGNPAVETLPIDFGGAEVAEELLALIEKQPTAFVNARRAAVAAATGNRNVNAGWWLRQIDSAFGTESESQWLRVGHALGVANRLPPEQVAKLTLTPAVAYWAMRGQVPIGDDSPVASAMLEQTLNGHCTGAPTPGESESCDLLTVFSPHLMRSLARGGSIGTSSDRTKATKRLRERDERFDSAITAMKVQKQTTGTTSRWVNTACELADIYGGPRWLFTEIAAIGLAQDPHKVKIGGAWDKNRPAFGPNMHYGNWVRDARTHSSNRPWWVTQLGLCTDGHAKAAWLLALVLAAPAETIAQLITECDRTLTDLDDSFLATLLATSARIGEDQLGRRLEGIPADTPMSAGTRLLLAHHTRRPTDFLGEDLGVLTAIAALPAGRQIAAAATTELAGRNTSDSTLSVVEAFESNGDTTPGIAGLTDEIAERILRAAHRLPADWVVHAERFLSSRDKLQPLRQVAESRWELT